MKTIKLSFFTLAVSTLLFTSCEKDDQPDTIIGLELPITLDCDYFENNANAVLIDNPNAPIDYIVTCKMSIPDNVTIQPGVTIAFETDAGFRIVSGSLKAAGTADKKITFTGVDKVPGAWSGIYFQSNDIKNELSHTVVEYAGGSAFNSNNDIGAVIIYSGTTLKFTNNLIQYSKEYGVNQNYRDVITSIENNTFKENNVPILVKAENIDIVKSNNEFDGNTINKVEVRLYTSEIHGNQTWRKLSIPYFTTAGTSTIGIKGHLIIEPGVIIEMGEGTSFRVHDGASLYIVGTPSEKIIIRGLTPQAGSWGHIYYTHTISPNNQIKHVEIRHGGSVDTNGAIELWGSPRLTIEDTHFEDIFKCAINGYQGPGNINYQENMTVNNLTYVNVGGEICNN